LVSVDAIVTVAGLCVPLAAESHCKR